MRLKYLKMKLFFNHPNNFQCERFNFFCKLVVSPSSIRDPVVTKMILTQGVCSFVMLSSGGWWLFALEFVDAKMVWAFKRCASIFTNVFLCKNFLRCFLWLGNCIEPETKGFNNVLLTLVTHLVASWLPNKPARPECSAEQ